MQIKLAYGKTGLNLNLPDNVKPTVVEPTFVTAVPDQTAAIHAALRNPLGAAPLAESVKTTDTVGIVFSDITRPTPNHSLIPAIVGELAHVPDEQIILFNATGTHRPNTESELRHMLGDAMVDRFRIVQNDANDRDSHVSIGTTSRGNQVWLHREFMACDVKIPTGFIEPHIFAGFSGGGKAIMPGLALLDTILFNHNAANLDDPRATWGITVGNPLWEDVHEAASLAGDLFLVNVTLNRDKAITGVFAGDLSAAHAAGCAFVKATAMVPVAAPFDIVITSNSGYPLDLNLYQATKGMSAAAQIVRPGGTIIAAAECWDGIPDHGNYANLLRAASNPADLLVMARDPAAARQDMWQIHLQGLISAKANVYVYSHHLTAEQIKSAQLEPCDDIEALIRQLTADADQSLCVLPEGPQTIPYLAADSTIGK